MLICVVFIQIGFFASGFAQIQEYSFNENSSTIAFTVVHMGFIEVSGKFEMFSGSIYFDPEQMDSTKAEIIIKTTSINTNSDSRDKSIRSEDFLDADGFPIIKFKSLRVISDDNQLALLGMLTIKRTSKELEFPFTYKQMDHGEIKLMGESWLTRSDYLLDFGAMDALLSDEVQITFDVVLKPKL